MDQFSTDKAGKLLQIIHKTLLTADDCVTRWSDTIPPRAAPDYSEP